MAKEVANDLIIAYGAEIYYTPDVVGAEIGRASCRERV